MKTIILCGGKGTRLQEETDSRPKPMVLIGDIPMLLHIMRLYAFYGHKEFILCLGYKGEMIREYFLHLNTLTQDLEIDLATGTIRYLTNTPKVDYRVTFVETGLATLTAERVKIAAKYISDDHFMVTYGDGISNININRLIAFHHQQTKQHKTLATLSAVHPSSKYGQLHATTKNIVKTFAEKPTLTDYINGGFMVFSRRALTHLRENEMLEDSLHRIARKRKLSQYRHHGFWHSMDTMKDVLDLRAMWETTPPWKV